MQVKKTKSGKYCFVERYRDINGKQKSVSVTYDTNTAKIRKQAQIELLMRVEEARTGSVACSMDFIKEEYIKYCKEYYKDSTLDRNESCNRHVLKLIGESVKYEDLTAGYVKAQLQSSGKSATTLNEYLRRFKAMLNWAFFNDYIPDRILRDKLTPFQEEIKDDETEKYLEFDQVQTLLDNLKVDRWRLAIQFLFLTGLRIGEFIALNKSDVDLNNRVIHINKNYDPNHKHLTTTKTKASQAEVYIQDELIPVVKAINEFMLNDQMANGYRTKLFMSGADGDYIHYYALNKYYKENTLACLGQEYTMHSTRHTHASLLFAQGMDLQAVKRRLRHSNSKVTEKIYIHVTKKLKEKDEQMFNAITLIC